MAEPRFIAYVRVSKNDQDTGLQLRDRTIRTCDKIFEEKVSSYADHRPALDECLAELRRGDTLVVWKLDRLGRKTVQLLSLIEDLERRGIHFVCTTVGLDTGTPGGRLMLRMLAACAEFERDTLIERTNAGLAVARDRGHVGGRRRALIGEKMQRAVDAFHNRPTNPVTGKPMSAKEVARTFGVAKTTLERYALHGGVPHSPALRAKFDARHEDPEAWLQATEDPNYGRNPNPRRI
jgi:DNA invertase Pin-like site-specific DNA recombinase